MRKVGEPVVVAREVRRSFGEIEAIRGVDVEIRRGEVFGFLGPNGAGKSTLIRMFMGLLAPDSGSVEVLGLRLPAEAERLRSQLGYMPQSFSLYQELSVQENLQFAAEIFGLARGHRRRRIEASLEEHGLVERRRQLAGTLSGGWKQRLALAAATIHRPAIVLLDEPTAGVDPNRRRAFWQKLFEMASEGTTVLVSTHYMDEAERCDRLCMLREGRRVALGRPISLIRQLTGRVVEVLAKPLEEATSVLQQRDEVASLAQYGSRLRVLLDSEAARASEVVPRLHAALTQAGLEVEAVTESEPSLEEVFVALTLGESLVDQEEPW